MIIAIRKQPNGSIYIDKEICSRTQEVQDEQGNITIQPLFSDETLSQPPYNYTKVEIDDKYSDCQASDFNDNLTFSIEKYTARKQKETSMNYEDMIVAKIRQKYSVNQELAILRQRDAKPEEFAEYNEYVDKRKENTSVRFHSGTLPLQDYSLYLIVLYFNDFKISNATQSLFSNML